MKDQIIRDSRPITLVGGGVFGDVDFHEARVIGPRIVAADGGACAALRLGHAPAAVIGDFDSISAQALKAIAPERLYRVAEAAEQDSTDFEKCLMRIHAPLIVGVGFAGARLDHELAALSALARYPDKRCVLIGQEMVSFLVPPRLRLDLSGGDLVSLFPLGPVRGASRGLHWPIDGIEFSPVDRIGTSNRATGPVHIWMNHPGMLMLLPRRRLGVACDALLSETETWPATGV